MVPAGQQEPGFPRWPTTPLRTWVRAFTSSTHIYVSVLGKDASPSDYPVRERLEEAVSLLTAS
ncbi:hypothetical protein E0H38_23420 [Rhizobium leguminosarum bv. viciae]|nr:hypothetical protein [Rhizobium leguminosarum bv. viciae]TBZ11681.1 hypothetical protein E0H38_23420 [Rhizobium leguminosarum bv. viciae]